MYGLGIAQSRPRWLGQKKHLPHAHGLTNHFLGKPAQMGIFHTKAIEEAKKIGVSIGIAVGGVGAMVLSKYLPEPLDVIATLGGIGLVGWAGLRFFNSFDSEGEQEGGTTYRNIEPAATPMQVGEIKGKITSPIQDSSEAFAWPADSDYDLKFAIYNPLNKVVSVNAVFDLYENGEYKDTKSQLINLKAMAETSGSIELEVYSSILWSPNITVYMAIETPPGSLKKLVSAVSFWARPAVLPSPFTGVLPTISKIWPDRGE